MKTENIERYLESFGKYLVKQMRTNLTKGKKNVSKDLYNSLKFKVKITDDGFSLQIFMADYGTFVDKGVSGTSETQSFKDYRGQDVPSPYAYSNKQPPSEALEKWIRAKGIKGRDRRGRFIKNKSLAFLIARGIKRNGIKGISFFQRPLQLGWKKFGGQLLQEVKKDIINTVNEQTNTN